MPEQLKVHSGERVDLVDYVHGSNTYTQETQKHLLLREWADRRARILDGFRVRVEDQVANPGMVTVFNGNAVDRAGQLLNNEQVTNDSRSITLLGASLDFYVEIEFLVNESSTDARYFWDPTIPNTAPEPNGSEFGINVATRLTPDWRIVSPVSTTGFEQTANPDSVRVPVGVFHTDGSNQIVTGSNPGMVFVRPASVLESDVLLGANSVRVVDARDFPATTPFSVTVDFGAGAPEAMTVSGLDRDNGIVTFTAPLAANHSAGSIVRVTSGTADLVRENSDPGISAHPDPAQRLWQANELRGAALTQSKETFGSRDDLNIRSLKDQVDFLAAQLRELKFGNPRPDIISTAPPITFATRPRWFDRAGSVSGARSNSVSIGNGTTSFGDINGTNGTAAVTAALAALPVSGGTIYVKAGTYDFATTVTVSKPVVFVGEHSATSVFNSTNAGGPAISASSSVRFVNMGQQRAGGASIIILEAVNAITFTFDASAFAGSIRLVNVNASVVGINSTFTAVSSNPIVTASVVTATLTFSTFTNCSFTSGGVLLICGVDRVRFEGCNLVCAAIWVPPSGAAVMNMFSVRHCSGTIAVAVSVANTTSGDITGLFVCDNYFVSTLLASGQAIVFLAGTGSTSRIVVEDNYTNVTGGVSTAVSPAYFLHIESNTATTGLSVARNHVDAFSGSFVVGVSLDQDTLSGSNVIRDNYFYRCMDMLRLGGTVGTIDTGTLVLVDNVHDNAGEHADVYGVRFMNNGRLDRLDVLNNLFSDYTSSTFGTRRGVDLTTNNNTSPGMAVEIRGNKFWRIYDPSLGTSTAYGIVYDATAGSAMDHQFNICDNGFYRISGDAGCAAIYLTNSAAANTLTAKVANNRINRIGVDGTTAYAYGIYAANFAGGGLSTSIMVTENTIYLIQSATGSHAASGIEIINCTAAQILNNYVASVRSTATTAAVGGAGIRVQGVTNNGLMVSGNHIDQGVSAVPGDSLYGIVIYSTGTLIGWMVKDNHIRSSTSGTSQIWVVGDGGGVYVNGAVTGNAVVFRSTVASAIAVYVHIGGASYNVKVDNNIIEETTYSAACSSHRGIVLQGTTSGGTPRALSVSNNMLVGPKSGALLSSTNRIGIWLRGALTRTSVVGNVIDWNEPGVLEGVSIKYLDDVTAGTWSGHLCASNFIRGDNAAAVFGDIDIDTADYTDGFLFGNLLGQPGAVGVINPAGAAGGWNYGTVTNKTS